MKMLMAQVVGGRVEVPSEIADGTHVTLLFPDDDEPIQLSQEEDEVSGVVTVLGAG